MSEEDIRFEMVKARHIKRFELAVKKGEADKLIVPLCSHINKLKNYFTSSSCSGRILLLGIKGKGKNNAYFHRKWHTKVRFQDVWSAIGEKTTGELWFKMESFIIHIGARTLKDAEKMLEIKNLAGIKRGGLITMKPGKFVLELIGTEDMALPVKSNNNVLVSEAYMREVVRIANKKMGENQKRLKKFEKIVRAELKW